MGYCSALIWGLTALYSIVMFLDGVPCFCCSHWGEPLAVPKWVPVAGGFVFEIIASRGRSGFSPGRSPTVLDPWRICVRCFGGATAPCQGTVLRPPRSRAWSAAGLGQISRGVPIHACFYCPFFCILLFLAEGPIKRWLFALFT